MIFCPNTTGVKLIEQYVDSTCYVDVGKSECHPTVLVDTFPKPKKIIPPLGEYSYVLDMGKVFFVREKNGKRQYLGVGAQRFQLQLPFSVEKQWFTARMKGWHYFAFNSR